MRSFWFIFALGSNLILEQRALKSASAQANEGKLGKLALAACTLPHGTLPRRAIDLSPTFATQRKNWLRFRGRPQYRERYGSAGRMPTLVRLRVRTNSGVEVPIGQNTGCP